MATQLLFAPLMAFKNGVFSPGATVEFYLSTTTTPVAVTDVDGLTIAQPVEADAAGVFPEIYRAGGAALKAVIKDSGGATIATIDPIAQVNSLGSAADDVSFTPVTGNTATDVQTAIENNTAYSVKSNVAETVTADWTISGLLSLARTGSADLLRMWRTDTGGATVSGLVFRHFGGGGNGAVIVQRLDDDGTIPNVGIARFEIEGTSAPNALSIITREKGDARYARIGAGIRGVTDYTSSLSGYDLAGDAPSGATHADIYITGGGGGGGNVELGNAGATGVLFNRPLSQLGSVTTTIGAAVGSTNAQRVAGNDTTYSDGTDSVTADGAAGDSSTTAVSAAGADLVYFGISSADVTASYWGGFGSPGSGAAPTTGNNSQPGIVRVFWR